VGRRLVLVVISIVAFAASASSAGAWVMLGPGSAWRLRPAQPQPHGRLVVRIRPGAVVTLRARPFGRVLERVGSTTEFGSPRAFAVRASHNGRWLAVNDAPLGNGRVAWIDARAGGVRYRRTQLEIDVDLSARMLMLRRGETVLRRARVGIGRPGSATPTGRFAVTDELRGSAYSASYGCCILALSATQPNLPSTWRNGNRIAIHGTPNTADFGRAVSAGCVHAPDALLHYLMRVTPLGTPVVIRR
jgi:lipoprotein-anchoring transpeptidase ErfK/SrfK